MPIALDATVVDQAIRYPTDLSLLNEARDFSEQIIDIKCKNLRIDTKPRTYRLAIFVPSRRTRLFTWINSIFLVMNLLILVRIFWAMKKVCSDIG